MGDDPLVIGDSAPPPAVPRPSSARQRWGVAAVALLLVGVLGALVLGDGVLMTVPSDSVTADADRAIDLGAPDAGILPDGFDGEVVMVATDGNRAALQVLARSGWGGAVELPPLDWGRFDESGRFVAGTAGPGSGLSHLWAGAVGEEMQLIAGSVRAFAWHDTDPGDLAWTALAPGGGLALTTADLVTGGEPMVVEAFDVGQLRRWGDWGFAFLQPGRPMRSLVVDAAGLQASELDGYPVGEVLPGLPGFTADGIDRSGEAEGTYGYDGAVIEVPWVPEGEYVRAVQPQPDGALRAVVASRTGLREAGRTLLVGPGLVGTGGEVLEWGAPSTGPAPLAWDVSGRFALAGSTGPGGDAQIDIIDTADGARVSVPVGARVILDLAVRPEP